MNAVELQTFDKKTRRRLFAWEVLVAIETKKLDTCSGYTEFSGGQCYSCALGAAYVFKNHWNPTRTNSIDRAVAVGDMREMGFSKNQIDIIEWVFEAHIDDVDDNPISKEHKDLYRSLKTKLSHASEDRISRMKAAYTLIFNDNKGEMKPLEVGE